tara:strand:- start:12 stop:143 length:132 start_codon:yes stop_codon:yes gene_type:complete
VELFFSIKKQRKGKTKNPKGKKKYGGNNKDVSNPSIKNARLFN